MMDPALSAGKPVRVNAACWTTMALTSPPYRCCCFRLEADDHAPAVLLVPLAPGVARRPGPSGPPRGGRRRSPGCWPTGPVRRRRRRSRPPARAGSSPPRWRHDVDAAELRPRLGEERHDVLAVAEVPADRDRLGAAPAKGGDRGLGFVASAAEVDDGASARPMLRGAPVTRATFPCNRLGPCAAFGAVVTVTTANRRPRPTLSGYRSSPSSPPRFLSASAGGR